MQSSLKIGQKVRVFGVVKDSWVIGEVSDVKSSHVTVQVKDWVGLPKSSYYSLPHSQIEVIGGGSN